MSKEAILNNVKNAINLNHLSSAEKPYKDLIKHKSKDIVAEYIALQDANKATIIESSDINATIKESLATLGAKKVLYTTDLETFGIDFDALGNYKIRPYDKSVDEIRNELFSIDTSIIYAKCGIADIGIFGLSSSPKHPRLASLITINCIVILEKKNIVPNILEGLKILRGDSPNPPSNIILVAGASRTADIELITVFGVHGPQRVHIILV